jgi:hypothetical protein
MAFSLSCRMTGSRPFGAGDDAFGVLERDDVEGGDGDFGVRGHEFAGCDDWHAQHLDADPNHTQGFPIKREEYSN